MLSWYDFCLILDILAGNFDLLLERELLEVEVDMEVGKPVGGMYRCSFNLLATWGIFAPI
jgi:hypothetical protein